MYITATVTYCTPGNYGPMMHTSGRRTYFSENELRRDVRNIDSVLSRKGANHIVLDRDTGLAFQVSGYNYHRGMYCDVLPLEELRPYLG